MTLLSSEFFIILDFKYVLPYRLSDFTVSSGHDGSPSVGGGRIPGSVLSCWVIQAGSWKFRINLSDDESLGEFPHTLMGINEVVGWWKQGGEH